MLLRARYHRILTASIMTGLMLLCLTIIAPNKTSALSGADFIPGRIIDDGVFYNSSTMSEYQIQQFLNSKLPVCDTWGTQPYAGTTRATYAASKGVSTPFVCMKDYSQTVPTLTNSPSDLCGGSISAGTKTAAKIIYEVSQVCGINPQILLILLQKEQSLVTDDWPWPIQYRSATGYGCPDTAPCDSEFYGFFNQVYQAAKAYKRYKANPANYNYRADRNNTILWHPTSSCGSSTVWIENQATAGLYIYTPYRPNQAALNNLYSTGDGCSSYGNRNFWRMFNDWFGTTHSVAWNYQFLSAKNTSVSVSPDQQSAEITITLRNLSSKAWYSDSSLPANERPTRLRTTNYQNTPFADISDPAWLGTRNQIRMTESLVQPGSNATFKFKLRGPLDGTTGIHSIGLSPVVDGVTSMPDVGMAVLAQVMPPAYNLVWRNMPVTILPNESFNATIQIRNTSGTTWYSDGSLPVGKKPFRLSTVGYQNTPFADISDPAWLGTRNQIKLSNTSVAPNQIATFNFRLRGPMSGTTSNLSIVPVLDGVMKSATVMPAHTMHTPTPNLTYQYISMTAPPSNMTTNTTILPQKVKVLLKNTSNTIWRNETAGQYNRIRLLMSMPRYRASAFYEINDTAWLTSSQIAMKTPIVNPGEIAEFEFGWKSPSSPGNYLEYFSLVFDGYGFFPEYGHAFRTIVN